MLAEIISCSKPKSSVYLFVLVIRDQEDNSLTLTIDSLVWAMSEMTPSVMMRRTKYWDPSFTEAAYLHTQKHIYSFLCSDVSVFYATFCNI